MRCSQRRARRSLLRLAKIQPAARLSDRNSAAGTMAPRSTSWVLITRSARPVALTASVWADSMASPRRIRTSEGGTTTPSVLATAIVAWRSGAGRPAARRLGSTARPSARTLAPTDPLMGPSSAPNPRPATTGAPGRFGSSQSSVRNTAGATLMRLSSTPMST